MQFERSDLEQSLLRELECPVCMDYMVPPIMMCVNGHNVCDICRPKIPRCPTCRQEFLSGRNVALEHLARDVKYPCSYQKYGCEEFLVHDTVREHQHRCHYRPQTCPVSKISNVQCGWNGTYNDIKKHLMEQHRGFCYGYIEGNVRVLRNVDACIGVFVFALNEVFCLIFRKNGDNLCTVLQYIGPAENAAKYKYRVDYVNADNTGSVTVMHLARSFHENFEDIFKAGNCVKVHCGEVSSLANEVSKFKTKIKVFPVGD